MKLTLTALGHSQSFDLSEAGRLTRTVTAAGRQVRSSLVVPPHLLRALDGREPDLLGAWWKSCLSGARPSPTGAGPADRPQSLRIVDLFAGAGGLTLGVAQLASEAGLSLVSELAVDTDAASLAVHARNHGTRVRSDESVASLIDYRVRLTAETAEFVYKPEIIDEGIAGAAAGADLILAGPPCQGHSNLNNHSRRSDRRNLYYLTVPAFAVACEAAAVIIENVTSVVHDRSGVVRTARLLLESCGYAVADGILDAAAMGWPQTRRRHFLVARRVELTNPSPPCPVPTSAMPPSQIAPKPSPPCPVPLSDVQAALSDEPARSVMWAIGLPQSLSKDAFLHESPDFSAQNLERIRWLFENDQHELALAERPECHQKGTSYTSVYGRMHADRPAPTITTGFMTPGRGRFVHPTQRRTLTPAEAARVQGFPDDYCFRPEPGRPATRSQLAKWIGDAVAMPLGYAAALSAIGPDIGAPVAEGA